VVCLVEFAKFDFDLSSWKLQNTQKNTDIYFGAAIVARNQLAWGKKDDLAACLGQVSFLLR
jgi:hypothetical protein